MILDTLAEATRVRVEEAKQKVSFEEMKQRAALVHKTPFAFEMALKKSNQEKGIAFICEVKKASPSKGIIADQFPYLEIAAEYEKIGADCLSVLTEPEYFKGSNEYLREIAAKVTIPILRKDFTIDEYMIYEAKALGADAVLLIMSLLNDETVTAYLHLCENLGLSALVETHNAEEIKRAAQAGARIIGVNNRNLKDFTVDVENCINLQKEMPQNVITVAESGISGAEEVSRIKESGIHAVLIGETLMRSGNRKETIQQLRGSL